MENTNEIKLGNQKVIDVVKADDAVNNLNLFSKYRKLLVVLSLVAFTTLICTIVYFFYENNNIKNKFYNPLSNRLNSIDNTNLDTIDFVNVTTVPSVKPAITSSTNKPISHTIINETPQNNFIELSANFQKPIASDLELEFQDEENGINGYIQNLLIVGKITSDGNYKDQNLLVGNYVHSGYQGKGVNAYSNEVIHLLLNKNTITILNSNVTWTESGKQVTVNFKDNPKQNLEYSTIIATSNLKIKELIYPSVVDSPSNKQKLNLFRTVIGLLNEKYLVKSFVTSDNHQVYSTTPDLQSNPNDYKSTIYKCSGDECLNRNGFYIFHPDNTYAIYSFKPSLSEVNINTPDSSPTISSDHYAYYSIPECNWENYLDFFNVSKDISGDELELYKTDTLSSTKVYKIKDKNNIKLKSLYESYSNSFGEWYKYFENSNRKATYDEFISSNPVLIWEDPFDRLVQLTNYKFVTPQLCEPVIYLYTDTNINVKVNFDKSVNITHSVPFYSNEWDLYVYPGSRIVNNLDGKQYPYLFWEGNSKYFSSISKGTVVAREEVVDYLDYSLDQLGLLENEIKDFKEAWVNKLTKYPYYQIYFYNQEFIDLLAPITVEPSPDTSIRILMDYRGLTYNLKSEDQHFPKDKPVRSGFTLVEWGGVQRP